MIHESVTTSVTITTIREFFQDANEIKSPSSSSVAHVDVLARLRSKSRIDPELAREVIDQFFAERFLQPLARARN